MNVLDEAAWEREINHANRVQEQREGWDGEINSFWGTDLLQIEIDELNKCVEAANNEINR